MHSSLSHKYFFHDWKDKVTLCFQVVLLNLVIANQWVLYSTLPHKNYIFSYAKQKLFNKAESFLFRAALVDVHMRASGPDFTFLQEITDKIASVYGFFNLGQEFHRFFDVARDLAASGVDLSFKFPRFFSTTRFENTYLSANLLALTNPKT